MKGEIPNFILCLYYLFCMFTFQYRFSQKLKFDFLEIPLLWNIPFCARTPQICTAGSVDIPWSNIQSKAGLSYSYWPIVFYTVGYFVSTLTNESNSPHEAQSSHRRQLYFTKCCKRKYIFHNGVLILLKLHVELA